MKNKREKKEIVLTTMHYRLYDLIKDETLEGGFLTTDQICEKLPDYFNSEVERDPLIYKTIQEINLAGKIEKWIVTDYNRIHIGTLADLQKLDDRYGDMLSKYGKLRYRLRKKMKNHNQYKALSEDNVPINESKGRRYVETYVK